MKLVDLSPTPCLCGRTSSPVWLETTYEVPGLRGSVHLCLDCLVEIQSHAHERVLASLNATVAELNARIAELSDHEQRAVRDIATRGFENVIARSNEGGPK